MKNQAVPFLPLALLAFLLTLNFQASTCFAQGTAFAYQGHVPANIAPPDATCSMSFALYANNATNGMPVAGPVTNADVVLSNGVFNTTIDFGDALNGGNWLEIAVADTNHDFIPLPAREQLFPVPYAITASNVTGRISSAQLPAGVVTNDATDVILSGVFSGHSTNLTVSAEDLTGIIPQENLGATNGFTPTIGNATADFITTIQSGYYAKEGNLVYFEVWVYWTNKGTATSGNVIISLPPVPVVSDRAVFNVGYFSGIPANGQLLAWARQGSTTIGLGRGSGSAAYPVSVTDCSETGELQITGTYRWR